MNDLLFSYRRTLKNTREQKNLIEAQLKQLEGIIQNKASSKLEKKKAYGLTLSLEEQKKSIASSIRDLEFAIEWMKTARMPGSRRGVERRSAYQTCKRSQYFVSNTLTFSWDEEVSEGTEMNTFEKFVLDKVKEKLTDRELEVYLMAKGNEQSQYEIAEYLNISRSSVQTMIARANRKVNEILSLYEEGVS